MQKYNEFNSIYGTTKYILKDIFGAVKQSLPYGIFLGAIGAGESAALYQQVNIKFFEPIVNATLNCIANNGFLLDLRLFSNNSKFNHNICNNETIDMHCSNGGLMRNIEIGSHLEPVSYDTFMDFPIGRYSDCVSLLSGNLVSDNIMMHVSNITSS